MSVCQMRKEIDKLEVEANVLNSKLKDLKGKLEKKHREEEDGKLCEMALKFSVRPKFKWGQLVKVRLDAHSIFVSKIYEEDPECDHWNGRSDYAIFDDCREEIKGRKGFVEEIKKSSLLTEPYVSPFDYMIRLSDGRSYSMCEDWLQNSD